MNNLDVSTEQLRQTASTLMESANRMESVLSEIKGLMQKIDTQGTWSGSSASAARLEFDRLAGKFPSFSEAVQNCGQGLNKFADNYDESEAKIKNALS